MKPQSDNRAASRKDRLLREHVHDPYQAHGKLPEPTVCPVCNAVFSSGRWQWKDSWPLDAHKEMCHACRRTQDGYPAGIVTLKGAFVRLHREELLQLARHHEEREKAEHPMHRILRIEDHPDAVVIRTTDIHLPRRLGEALHHAYKGELHTHYDEEGYLARVTWSRER
jgi:hypothetical protein